MAVGSRLVPVLVLACLSAACSRNQNQLRKDPLRPTLAPPAPAPAARAFIPPIPPDPPPLVAAGPAQPPAGAPAAVPDSPVVPAAARVPAAEPAPDPVRTLLDTARRRYADVPDYAARLVKREVVGGRPVPPEEMEYKVRVRPLSVSIKVLSDSGRGREVIFVKGRDDGGMHVVTGKGDSPLVGVGFKTTVDPDSRQATAKSRYRVYEAGFGRTLDGLARVLAGGAAGTVTATGPVTRPEFSRPAEGLEVRAPAGPESVIREGGTRRVFFDPDPSSPGYQLPVLVETKDLNGRETEYYWFSRLRAPAGLTDADFDPGRMGKK